MLWTVLIAKRNIMIFTKKKIEKKNVMERIYKGTFYSGLKFDYILIILFEFMFLLL